MQWWLGDWLNYGERQYGEMYSQAIEEVNLDYGTLRNFKYVSSRIELSRRRDKLSWFHHREVAAQCHQCHRSVGVGETALGFAGKVQRLGRFTHKGGERLDRGRVLRAHLIHNQLP